MPLIDLPTDEACAVKWAAGRMCHGPEFQGDPLMELDAELIDAINYADEAARRGIPMDGIRSSLCALRDRVGLVFSTSRGNGNSPHIPQRGADPRDQV